MFNGLKKGCFIGDEVYAKRDAEKVNGRELEIISGDFHSWDDIEEVWKYTFKKLKIEPSQLTGIIITGKATDTIDQKERIVKTLFETYDVHNFCLANSVVMSLYSTGRTNGLVVKSGESLTRAVPVFEGHIIPHAV